LFAYQQEMTLHLQMTSANKKVSRVENADLRNHFEKMKIS